MTLAPRAVLVHRTTEYEELLARHGSHGQAAYFQKSRGRDIRQVVERHDRAHQALAGVAAAVPQQWRQAQVERADLDRFLFAPEDVVVVVGQDGLVANVAKYLTGQPVIGIDTDPGRNPGVLVRHRVAHAAPLLRSAGARRALVEELTMVEAVADDTQRLLALNEIYLGPPGHQTARYHIDPGTPGAAPQPTGTRATRATRGDRRTGHGHRRASATGGAPSGARSDASGGESQASSGVLVGTGTGATGWLRSLWQQTRSDLTLPGPTEERLVWFVREAWPSPATGTSLVEGELSGAQRLRLTVEAERLIAFGDGMETDALDLTWGQTVRVGVADASLRLLG